MEIKYRRGLRTRTQFGLVKNLGTMFRRVTAIRLDVFHERIPAGMFVAGHLPYEASETYRKIKTEFENRHSIALVEARALQVR
jgi:hypothetical protein